MNGDDKPCKKITNIMQNKMKKVKNNFFKQTNTCLVTDETMNEMIQG